MISRYDNYISPKNYICIPLPSTSINRRIRVDGCPFVNCKRYTVAFTINEDYTPGDIICGWPGYSYNCPMIPFWDSKTKWSVLQTDFITE